MGEGEPGDPRKKERGSKSGIEALQGNIGEGGGERKRETLET